MMVVLVALEVLVQVIDASGQQSDLYFGGTGVAFMAGVGLHNFSLVDHENDPPSWGWRPVSIAARTESRWSVGNPSARF